MKALFKLIAVVLYFALLVGVLLPFLFSAKSTIAFVLGVVAIIVTMVSGCYFIINYLEGNK